LSPSPDKKMMRITSLRSWRQVTLVLLAAVLVATGCGDADMDKPPSGKPDTIVAGKLRVGSDIPYVPFEFGQAPYRGFDVDVVREIGKRIDLEPRFVKTQFDPIFRNLAQGRFDMVASAATISPELEKTVDFSDPYLPADQSLVVKRGSVIASTDDLAGKIVGAQVGTAGADFAKNRVDAKSVRNYDLIDDAFKALEAGQVDAVIHDFPRSKYEEQLTKKDLTVVQTIGTGKKYGLAFNKDSQSLRLKVNQALREMKDDGTYATIYKRWFRSDPPDSILEAGNSSNTASGN
jgi:ABC-type amino acid transport substrate-binding protein